jgi:hypothetical protein
MRKISPKKISPRKIRPRGKFIPDENSSPSNLSPRENFKFDLDDFLSFGGFIEL